MQFAKTVLFVLVAVFWTIASSHCKLEAIPALAFIACSDEGDCNQASTCDDDACASVEEGLYFHKHVNPTAVKIVSVLPFVLLQPVENSTKVVSRTLIDTSPQAPPSRHFVDRTALPVRAPSLVS